MPKTPRKQLLVVDDHPMLRAGLAQLIGATPDLKVCAEADNAGQALAAIAHRDFDLVLLDISLPDKNGVEVIKDIQALKPGLPMLVVSMHDELLYAERVIRAGARGYIMKEEGGKKFLQAIRQVLAGQIYVSDKMAARVLENLSGGRAAAPIHRLSDREFEVFQLIGRGKGTREIAGQLHLSVKTIEVHRANLKKKLELKTATDLVHYAIRWMESEPRAGG